MPPNLKPEAPFRATRTDWLVIRNALLPDKCWVCGAKDATNLHHILPRDGAGTWPRGDDITVNLAPVCGSGTTGCHGLLEARDPWARSQLRQALQPSNVFYLDWRTSGRAEAFLERHYPIVVGTA